MPDLQQLPQYLDLLRPPDSHDSLELSIASVKGRSGIQGIMEIFSDESFNFSQARDLIRKMSVADISMLVTAAESMLDAFANHQDTNSEKADISIRAARKLMEIIHEDLQHKPHEKQAMNAASGYYTLCTNLAGSYLHIPDAGQDIYEKSHALLNEAAGYARCEKDRRDLLVVKSGVCMQQMESERNNTQKIHYADKALKTLELADIQNLRPHEVLRFGRICHQNATALINAHIEGNATVQEQLQYLTLADGFLERDSAILSGRTEPALMEEKGWMHFLKGSVLLRKQEIQNSGMAADGNISRHLRMAKNYFKECRRMDMVQQCEQIMKNSVNPGLN